MTGPAFAPNPPADLVLPRPSSTTARAVCSLALRKLFDWVKSTELPEANPGFGELRAIFGGFLPGRPKQVAALLDEPTVSAPLRLLRSGAALDSALLGQRAADAARAILARGTGAARAPTVSTETGALFVEWNTPSEIDLQAFAVDVRAARALLFGALPSVAAAHERVARLVVPTEDAAGGVRIESQAPAVFGIGFECSVVDRARALARGTTHALLVTLRELDAIGDELAFERLLGAAMAAVDDRLVAALHESRRAELDLPAAREAFLAAFRELMPFERALTSVGRGVFDELAHHAGYAPTAGGD
ncbi:MAG: hypothetical protein H5U40_09190 [Polyangiaceae bacterium]|nr:hypothetical protein [Polyangiaceae bacterium]